MERFATPRSAYIHVPFCRHRCGYCNFTLVAGRDDLIADYLRAIKLELHQLTEPREVDTLFFGGGTPTHLSPRNLEALLTFATDWFPLAPGAEVSVEANPADITPEIVSLLADHGVNRLSLGVQSFDRDKLSVLERDHDADIVTSAIAVARTRISNISLDLIFGTPNESVDLWRRDLELAISLSPRHVSTYGLTFERGTPYWSRLLAGDLQRLDEETERSMYATAIDELIQAGFEHYEVSNFAHPGFRCRHNEAYWTGSSYYAVGPGAARYVDGRREMNHRSTTTYLKRILSGHSAVAESEMLAPEERARERLVFGLRRLTGIDRQQFHAQTGYTVDELIGKSLSEMTEHGLLFDDGRQVKLTREGLFVSDAIWPHFLRT